MKEIHDIGSDFNRERTLQAFQERAKILGCKTEFNKLYKSFVKDMRYLQEIQEEECVNITSFSGLEQQLICGDWIANDDGIKVHTDKGFAEACYHPIYPTKILRNAETGQYKVELKFKVRGTVRTALVDKSVIATPTKIVGLANHSVQVTGINAPYLVKFLADLESMNPDLIKECTSTSRLGWIVFQDKDGKDAEMFLPYDQEVVFDNENNTKALFDSIRAVGDRNTWYDTLIGIRKKKQTEVLINLASSYASVLVEPCGALPFIVSLWGGTGIGKTVVLMLATSVWADPSEGQYMTDAKATSTAMEIRLNILNSLPMTLDDMAQIKNQQDEDFSQLIYRWCAGKGRDRSNVNLGLNKLTSWRNCTITNGERSLVDESTQGGAVNRVIDIESSGEALFSGEEGNRVANIVRKNFGYSGRDFIDVLKGISKSDLNEIKDRWFKAIKEEAERQGCEKEDKQIMPMALILTADELTEKYLFKDGIRLDLEKCVSYLKNKGEVSEHKRAYEYMLDQIEMNQFHFSDNKDEAWNFPYANWGFFSDDNQVAIIPTIFEKLLKDGSFQGRAFKSWAKKEGLIVADTGRNDKMYKINGKSKRYIVLKTDTSDGFEDAIIENLPFD